MSWTDIINTIAVIASLYFVTLTFLLTKSIRYRTESIEAYSMNNRADAKRFSDRADQYRRIADILAPFWKDPS